MSFEIGYRHAPKNGQFTKGKSGNPKGRPKGAKNFITLLEQELAQAITVNENGRKKCITRMQALVKRTVASALQGDLKSLMTLVEILRRSGKLETANTESLLPDDYKAILESYFTGRQKVGSTNSKLSYLKDQKS